MFFSLIAGILFPGQGAALYLLKIIGISIAVGFIEVSVAKMRLFRAVDFLAFSFAISLAAVVISVMGA